jgi:hypothetical protein
MTKIKRSQIQTFINTIPANPHVLVSPSIGASYVLLGPGVVTGEVNMNPKSTTETYLADDSGSTTIDSYAPTYPVEQTAILGDGVFNFVDQLRLDRAILGAAETDIVNVWMYETGGTAAYPAEQQMVSISVENFGDAGGEPIKLNYTINFVGNGRAGTFDSSTKVFTVTP